jgi:hypothetical protein
VIGSECLVAGLLNEFADGTKPVGPQSPLPPESLQSLLADHPNAMSKPDQLFFFTGDILSG